jgi:Cu(I)/Ag(I) efflux system membrane fusion protein
MKLVPKEDGKEKQAIKDTALSALLKPTNEFAISSIPTVKTIHKYLPLTLKALGAVSYDTRQMGSVSANISGRIEKLYVRSRYQQVKKGQRIMDIYSPEILTAQENLLMVLRNDPSNEMMISSAKQKLLLLGMSGQQLQEVIKKGKPDFSISVFSNYNGYIKDVQEECREKLLRL